jgi:hypothetical protein
VQAAWRAAHGEWRDEVFHSSIPLTLQWKPRLVWECLTTGSRLRVRLNVASWCVTLRSGLYFHYTHSHALGCMYTSSLLLPAVSRNPDAVRGPHIAGRDWPGVVFGACSWCGPVCGCLCQVHAENGDAVAWGQRHVAEVLNVTGPGGHGLSRPAGLEGEATGRAIRWEAAVLVGWLIA